MNVGGLALILLGNTSAICYFELRKVSVFN